jgi:hypothetical protein
VKNNNKKAKMTAAKVIKNSQLIAPFAGISFIYEEF